MRGLKLASALLVAATCASSVAGFAQTSQTMLIRAIRTDLSADLITFIARNARPFSIASNEYGKSLTGRDIAARLCGTFYEAYWRSVLEVNKGNVPPLEKEIADAAAFTWPRCLYAQQFPPGSHKIVVARGETAALIYRRYTGSAGAGLPLARFFGGQLADDFASIKVGQTVAAAYRTIPVSVTPIDGNRAAFEANLRRIAAAGGAQPEAIYVLTDPPQGRIVVAAPSLDSTAPPIGLAPCAPFDNTDKLPIRPERIVGAYERAYGEVLRRNPFDTPDRARIVVVDNGFFGADPDAAEPFGAGPFPKTYFRHALDGSSLLWRRISVETWDTREDGSRIRRLFVDPINSFHLLPVNPTSGHGTHVTGLVLGGPSFKDSRNRLRPGNAPWAEITIFNVGKGEESLLDNAHTQIRTLLTETPDPAYVINMSIAYERNVDGMFSVFDVLRSSIGPRSVFVVAAGNDGKSLSTMALLPGSLGGIQSPNIITVAAHDTTGRIIDRSNRDDAVVDIAAPGCGIHSWLSNADLTTPMDGTSMATPLVTFGAALLRSLLKNTPARELKARLIASADLLPDEQADRTNYGGLQLNVAKALYWFDDYLRVGNEEFLGTLVQMPASARRCSSKPAPQALEEIWSVKRRPNGGGVLHLGRLNYIVQSHCSALDLDSGDLVFRATHRIQSEKLEPIPDPADLQYPMRNVRELVLRSG